MPSVVLCALSAKYPHATLTPYCLLSGLRAFSKTEVSGKVVEGTVNEAPSLIAERILAEDPSLVTLSVYIWNRRESEVLAALLKERAPGVKLLVGGPEVAYCAEEFLKENPAVDFLLSGEGEAPIAALYDALITGEGLPAIPGLIYRSGGGLCRVPEERPLAIPPSPITPEYLSAVRGRIAYLETSRGCPYRCAFCLSGREGGVRYFPMERVLRELLLLAGSGPRIIKLIDRSFNADRARARKIWQFLIDEWGRGIPRDARFHFEIAGELLEEADFALLERAPHGLFRFEIGIQSFNPQTLAAIDRPCRVDALAEKITRLTSCGNIEIHIDLIAGLPQEDLTSFAAGIDRAASLGADMLQLGFLKLLHGAKMRSEPSLYPCRYHEEPPYEVVKTPWLSEAELCSLHGVEAACERLYNSGHFQSTLAYLTGRCAIRPYTVLSSLAVFAAARPPLNALYDEVYRLMAVQPSVNPSVLRDRLLYDRLTSNADTTLPKTLFKEDKSLSFAKKTLQNEAKETGRSARLSVGILYTEGKLLAVYYDELAKDGGYKKELYPLQKFTEEKRKITKNSGLHP